jgi:hypothetical protein
MPEPVRFRMSRLLAPRIKLISEPNMEWTESQYGPPSNARFRPKMQSNSRFSYFCPWWPPKHSLKEVAALETFPTFFRLNM